MPKPGQSRREQIHEKLLLEEETNASVPRDGETLTAEWEALSNVLQQAASDSLGFCSRKHQDWFDDSCIGIHELLKTRNDAYPAKLQNPSSVSLDQEWKALRSRVKKELRQMENTGGCLRPKRFSPMLTPMRRKSFMMQSRQPTAPRTTLCTP